MTSYLKKIGFAATDGTPTKLFKQFRNSSTSGAAVAEALKVGYAPLYKRNEYIHKLSGQRVNGLNY